MLCAQFIMNEYKIELEIRSLQIRTSFNNPNLVCMCR